MSFAAQRPVAPQEQAFVGRCELMNDALVAGEGEREPREGLLETRDLDVPRTPLAQGLDPLHERLRVGAAAQRMELPGGRVGRTPVAPRCRFMHSWRLATEGGTRTLIGMSGYTGRGMCGR